MFDLIGEETERRLAVDTVEAAVRYVRALKLMLDGIYLSTPKDSETEKNALAARYYTGDVLAWLEIRAAALTPKPPSDSPAETPSEETAATSKESSDRIIH